MRILLASSSPRRRELLERAGLAFEVEASPAEEIHDETMAPERLCEENAILKAAAVASHHPQEIVIGADTPWCSSMAGHWASRRIWPEPAPCCATSLAGPIGYVAASA